MIYVGKKKTQRRGPPCGFGGARRATRPIFLAFKSFLVFSPWRSFHLRNLTHPILEPTPISDVLHLKIDLTSTKENDYAWYPALADWYPDSNHHLALAFWSASLGAFVLSGHRGDQIYYEKAIFSCGGRVVNVLAVAYPEAERQRFDPFVERMEDSFKGGRGCG